jgi:hypothetical protein
MRAMREAQLHMDGTLEAITVGLDNLAVRDPNNSLSDVSPIQVCAYPFP